MSVKKHIRKICFLTLGCSPEPDNWDVWERVSELSEYFGARKVQEAFEEWAAARQHDEFKKGPVTEFLKVAPGLCTGIVQIKPKGDLYELLNSLAEISGNRIIFNRDQQAAVYRLLDSHLPADIKSAFKEFWENIENDEFSVRQGAKTFTEGAEQLLAVQARRREREKNTQELLTRSIEREQHKAKEELERAQRERESEESLIEDEL